MKLSKLVGYLNHLESMGTVESDLVAQTHFGSLLHLVKTQNIQLSDLSLTLDQDYNAIRQSITGFNSTVAEIKNQLRVLISEMQTHYFSESYRLYDQEMIHDSTEHILNRRFSLTDDVKTYVQGRIRLHGDWRYPGMILRPGLEEWIHDLVGCDPLYLVDQSHDLLLPAMQRFNAQYQKRLCTYVIKDLDQSSILHDLPSDQMAFCLAYNFFNYKPFEVVKQYLQELYNCLRPGGVLAMTFNDCDRAGAVDLVERHFMCYTPGEMVTALARSLGFEIKQIYQMNAACTWLELSKPGELSGIRGGQSLAKIVEKSK